MTWLNPWAWAGLLLVGGPVLVHLLARRSARVRPFPTLRFLPGTRLQAMRRSRLDDVPLLLVRIAIIVAAVAALAQPHWRTHERSAAATRAVTRVVVIDTSASMRRPSPGGGTALAAARVEAAAIVADAVAAVTLESALLPAAIAGAAAFLDTRAGIRELVVVSDFQHGSVDSADFRSVAPGTGVRLLRMEVQETPSHESVVRQRFHETVATVETGAARNMVTWRQSPSSARPDDAGVVVLAGETERTAALAARAAAATQSQFAADAKPLAFLFPEFEQRTPLLERARSPDRQWMIEALMHMRRDHDLAGTVRDAAVPADAAGTTPPAFLPVVRNAAGLPAAYAVAADVGGRDALVIVVHTPAGSVATAALIAAAERAVSPPPAVRELEPSFIDDERLRGWERAPETAHMTAAAPGTESDARWLWLACLLLLVAEAGLRRWT